jgi:hypothetical protein
MRNLTLPIFFAAILLSTQAEAHAQNQPSPVQKGSSTQQHVPYEIQLGSKVAETLLIHKEEPA